MDISPSMIEIREVNKDYLVGKTTLRALENVNLSIDPGEFVTISGPSGSGKTTLLNLLGLLDFPSTGSIWIDGLDISVLKNNKIADFRRRNIGFIFQLHQLIPTITTIENVMLPLLPYKREVRFNLFERAQTLLHDVGLEQCVNKLPAELSGGEQQRVAIARALINSPKIILADEPTGNLDQSTGEEIIQLLCEINLRLNTTILLVTHNSQFAQVGQKNFSLLKGLLSNSSSVKNCGSSPKTLFDI